MSDQIRKTIPQLKAEYDRDRHMYGKVFHHWKSGDDYQLLFPIFNEETNEKKAVFCMCAMPWLKFERPFEKFKETFIEGPHDAAQAREKADG